MQVGGANVQAFYFMANTQVGQAQPQQLQQLQGMMTQAFQSLFQMAAGQSFGQLLGTGQFPQMPGQGHVAPPGGNQFPSNPRGQGIQQLSENPPKFKTPGGYTVEAEGKSAAWKITTPEGKTTRIWGDPHVKEGDGGKWDFKKGMSFVLPDGTKITARTTPPRSNGYTVTKGIDIQNGNQVATINGIDNNKPTTTGVRNDRWSYDARVPDGDYAILGGDGDDWFLHGKSEIVGSEKQGEILKTKQGAATGITPWAQMAANEVPKFGSSPWTGMMQNQIQGQLQGNPFGSFGGSPFNYGGMGMSQMPGAGGYMGGLGGGNLGAPGMNAGMGYAMGGKIQGMFDTLRGMSQQIQNTYNMMRMQQSMMQQAIGGGFGQQQPAANPNRAAAQTAFNKILEQSHMPFDHKADNMARSLSQKPELLGALNPQEKGRLIQILGKGWKSEADERAMVNILRSGKSPQEFKGIVDSAGGQKKLHGMLDGKEQGTFNYLLEKNNVKPWKPPFSFLHPLVMDPTRAGLFT